MTWYKFWRWKSVPAKTAVLVGGSLATTGATALVLSSFGVALPAALASIKAGEALVSGATILGTSLKFLNDKKQKDQSFDETKKNDLIGFERWVDIVALVAYLIISIPIAFIVFSISQVLPVSSMIIAGCFAYVGFQRFIGYLSPPPHLRTVYGAIIYLT